ncbi:MAG: bifunctional phosphopantothenoylcysteine decarboxylase/phosphopantothenate--cysteine ligase CoaBC [Bacilli bacterium]|nr:bifunctional phosphopantothenoylcysteine decarboxylase/phosphopantothenate--cysteine ligase CoaBC [Bacilli bacterium]
MKNINIVIGITGGIAAYKACGIVSYLKSEGANVDVIMTKNACEFITPLTLETLSGNKVITDMFERPDHREVEHISLARKADLFLIVPATANILGKVANGIADDMLSTTIMATKAPVVFAPAMNDGMYSNPIVQDNIKKLRDYGYKFIEPATGHLACGYDGKGKLAKNEDIIDYVKVLVKEKK